MREIRPGVIPVGALDWDRRIFDELIPLPEGTSYNAYVVKGSTGTALIDTVDPTKLEILLGNLGELGLDRLDYIVANHAEQDHSGVIPRILSRYPSARAITTPKGKEFLKLLLHVPDEKIQAVQDRETLSLGDRTLEFIHTPWVHWPETMLTWLREDRILFTCDLFGSHYATDELFVSELGRVYWAAKRYYAEIMMPFRGPIKGHLEKIRPLPIGIIAPSHGPVYRKPELILDAYRDWVSDRVKNEVVIPYVSMHHSTAVMVHSLEKALADRGVPALPFNLTVTDIGELAMALVDAATVVVGTPTVLTGPHPAAVYAAYLVKILKPKTRAIGIIGSYGWGGRTVKDLAGILQGLPVEFLEPVLVKGLPTSADLLALDALAEKIAEKHRAYGIL
ncbi:MAG TPA: FprA family A-type flavoprotein [Methanomicrobiales archaeon]|jgi:flavorubredoxin|nr:FprA family A-type flavoprotein [Methanomicrobiales archaeon]